MKLIHGNTRCRVKLFAEKDRVVLEDKINDWLSGNTFLSVDFQYATDLQYWTCLAVYEIEVKA